MTDDTVPAKLAEWEALAAGATLGPWEASVVESMLGSYFAVRDTAGRQVFFRDGLTVTRNGEFIAAARQMVPALLGFVREVLTLIDEDHCPGGCEHDAIDAEVLGDRIKRALMEQIGGEG